MRLYLKESQVRQEATKIDEIIDYKGLNDSNES